MTLLRAAIDSWVNQASQAKNYGDGARLSLNGGGGTNDRQAFIHFARPFPLGATIVSAKLRVHTRGLWAGTQTLTAKRVVAKWAESRLTWANKPGIDAAHAAALVVTDAADKAELELDVAAIMQDVSGGAPYFGLRLEIDTEVFRGLHASEATDADMRPELEVEWSLAPDPPTILAPAGGRAVSIAKPVLAWDFTDPTGDLGQASSQVQIDDVADFSSPNYDSGKVANTLESWDLATASPAYGGIAIDAVRYWRVRVWDPTDLVSEWSDVATFTRKAKGTVTIDSPPSGGTVDDLTPPIDWTFTGASGSVQEAYQVIVREDVPGGSRVRFDSGRVTGTDTALTLPTGVIVSGNIYRVTVRIWDDVDRALTPGDVDYVEDVAAFSYVASGTPAKVTTLSATVIENSPAVFLEWHRTTEPDYFCLVIDGVEVMPRIDPDGVAIGGGDYAMTYWAAPPRVATTFEVQAVVDNAGTLRHSTANATDTVTTDPNGIWLADPVDNKAVRLGGQEQADIAVGESGVTHYLSEARAPVRITSILRGYEGTLTGVLRGPEDRDAFLELKSRLRPLRLIISDINIIVELEEVAAPPTPLSDDRLFRASFAFVQVDDYSFGELDEAAAGSGTTPGTVSYSPAEVDTLFRNPDMGWVPYNFDPDEDRASIGGSPGGPTGYPAGSVEDHAYASMIHTNNFTWADLEPIEGDRRWDALDAYISYWDAQGKDSHIGVTGSNDPARYGMEPFPQWLRDLFPFIAPTRIQYLEPPYADAAYLDKRKALIDALAAQYYARPLWQRRLKRLSVVMYGMFGEWWSNYRWRTQTLALNPNLAAAITNGPITVSFDDLVITAEIGLDDNGEALPPGTRGVAWSDQFTRTVSNGLGTPTTKGPGYTILAADQPKWSVDGSRGKVVLAAGETSRASLTAISRRDPDGYIAIYLDRTPAGGGVNYDITMRHDASYASNTEYFLRVIITQANEVKLEWRYRINGATSVLIGASVTTALTHVANAPVFIRWDAFGMAPTALKAKAWTGALTDEPGGVGADASWDITRSDSTAAFQVDIGEERYLACKRHVDDLADAFPGAVKPEFVIDTNGSSIGAELTLAGGADPVAIKYAVEERGFTMQRRNVGPGMLDHAVDNPDEDAFVAAHLADARFATEWGSGTGVIFILRGPITIGGALTAWKKTWEGVAAALARGASSLGWHKNSEGIGCSTIPADVPLEEIPEASACTIAPAGYKALRVDVTLGLTALQTKLDAAKALGAEVIHFACNWTNTETSDGVFSWTKLDQAVDQCEAKGLKPVLQLQQAPAWTGTAGGWDPPIHNTGQLDQWKAFCTTLAARFGTRVALYEVWNEPNGSGFWASGSAQSAWPGEYAKLLRYAAEGLRAGNAGVKIGGMNPSRPAALGYIGKVYDALEADVGIPTCQANGYYFDLLSLHPYHVQTGGPFPPDSPAGSLDTTDAWGVLGRAFQDYPRSLALVLAREGVAKQAYFGEFGYATDGSGGNGPVTNAVRAGYLPTAYSIIRTRGDVWAMRWHSWNQGDTYDIVGTTSETAFGNVPKVGYSGATVVTAHPLDKLYPGTTETLRDYAQRRLGYRLYPSRLTWPERVGQGAAFVLKSTWYQRAVAKLYDPEFQLGVRLVRGSSVYPLTRVADDFGLHELAPGPQGPVDEQTVYVVPLSTPRGTYRPQFAIVDAAGNPAVNLAADGKVTTGLADPVHDPSWYDTDVDFIVA